MYVDRGKVGVALRWGWWPRGPCPTGKRGHAKVPSFMTAMAAPGDLDPTFGNNGRVLTPFGGINRANDVI